jgi:hypothetical protein
MSLTGGKNRLIASLKELQLRWSQVRGEWDDDVRKRFEEEYLVPREREVQAAVAAIERMAETVARARRDCS